MSYFDSFTPSPLPELPNVSLNDPHIFDYLRHYRASYRTETTFDLMSRQIKEASELVLKVGEQRKVAEQKAAEAITAHRNANARTRTVLALSGVDVRGYCGFSLHENYEIAVGDIVIARVASEDTACQIGAEIVKLKLAGKTIDATQFVGRK
jgi:hypothetical protein